MAFSIHQRPAMLLRLQSEIFDMVIVGGGITGAGVARDAALRGLKVALIERGDFAIGTSSRSSKLIHGGVRYLEMGDVALVFEAVRERQRLSVWPRTWHGHSRFCCPCTRRAKSTACSFWMSV